MAKRSGLSFDQKGLTQSLRTSSGQGVDALFPGPNAHPIDEGASPAPTQPSQPEENPTAQQSSEQASDTRSNMTILPLSDEDIEVLREPAYKAQTFRMRQEETEWLRDMAYRLSKEVKRGRVAQADIVRISLKLFEGLLATNKADLMAILERIFQACNITI